MTGVSASVTVLVWVSGSLVFQNPVEGRFWIWLIVSFVLTAVSIAFVWGWLSMRAFENGTMVIVRQATLDSLATIGTVVLESESSKDMRARGGWIPSQVIRVSEMGQPGRSILLRVFRHENSPETTGNQAALPRLVMFESPDKASGDAGFKEVEDLLTGEASRSRRGTSPENPKSFRA
ncbi:MAG TPA: hypothetical protein VJ547_11270 [Candidatus Thermoplasmatota archaeon]|nr:hypothetical protein [Candidatus Thermoplasmatota archaeon]